MRIIYSILRYSFLLSILFSLSACITTNSTTQEGAVGVKRGQFMSYQKEKFNREAAKFYESEKRKYSQMGTPLPNKRLNQRVRRIANRLIAQTPAFRKEAMSWDWEVNVFHSDALNAYCVAGGKIGVYSALITQLNLSDDEIAAILGHEIAHALREHSRELNSRRSAAKVIKQGIKLWARIREDRREDKGKTGGMNAFQIHKATDMADVALVYLPHSRKSETEADIIGVELAARAGYNPRAAVSFWRKMAMANPSKAKHRFLSTHPDAQTRIKEIQAKLPRVTPLYAKARAKYRKRPTRHRKRKNKTKVSRSRTTSRKW